MFKIGNLLFSNVFGLIKRLSCIKQQDISSWCVLVEQFAPTYKI